jgi:predicted RNA-binding protein
MCEANAYLIRDDNEELILEAVDIIEPLDDGFRLVDIFGTQKSIKARLLKMNLVDHKILFKQK